MEDLDFISPVIDLDDHHDLARGYLTRTVTTTHRGEDETTVRDADEITGFHRQTRSNSQSR